MTEFSVWLDFPFNKKKKKNKVYTYKWALCVFLKVLKVRKDRAGILEKVFQGMMVTKASEVG